MTEQEKRDKLTSIAFKLEEMAGHKRMIDTIHGQVYAICEELGIEDDLGYDLGNCESEFDYENLGCNVSNDEDEWLTKIK